ncbi:MAG: glutamate 5-kinase [Candidatus Hydrogenedentota bacterium]
MKTYAIPDTLKTLVIKLGTQLLSGKQAFEGQVMEAVVQEIAAIKRGHALNVLLVSSGAVGCGMNALGIQQYPKSLPERQAVAAVGQATLMHYYETLLNTYGDGLRTAQVLLSWADLDNRRSYLNVRNTINTLFEMKRVIPIVNENDSTAVEELCFGDNDTLAAKIAAKINADLLIILSDVDGLYDNEPGQEGSRLIRHVTEITPEIEASAGGAGSAAATGGMRTKLEAARIASAAGVGSVIANGHTPEIIHRVLAGTADCTHFAPGASTLSHRKRWIAFGRAAQGKLHVDTGAARALTTQGKSLLAAGIRNVEGTFDVGAAVAVVGPEGRTIARALVNYTSDDIARIMGHKSKEIADILGRKDFDEVAHRDNMVVL